MERRPGAGSIVILGAGMAGGVAARTLREEGYSARLVLIGDEPGVPFGRPPLSKTYLQGKEDLSGWLVRPAEWYRENEVDVVRARATAIDVDARRVLLNGLDAIPYDSLLIATGGRNRRLSVPGAELPGVYQLRTVADCDAIRAAAGQGGRALIVGMGFIGSEVAASLRQLGLDVSAVLPGAAPLESVIGPEFAQAMAGIHRDAGVELVTGDEVVRLEGSRRLERAITKRGRRIDCDLAVVAVGIEPNVDIVRNTKVEIDNGILVDARCATSVPNVFAAGDVANHLHPVFGRVRVEHYNNAEKQGAAAARAMLGANDAYGYIHSFWSDQYADKIEYAGHVRRWDNLIVRGSLEDRQATGFYLQDGVLRAAIGLNRGGDPELDADGELAAAARLIARGARPEPSALADADLDLRALV